MRVAFLHVEEAANNPFFQRKLAEIMVASVRRVVQNPHVIQMTDFATPAVAGTDETRRLEPNSPFFMNYRLRHLKRLDGEVLILDTDTVVLQDPSKVFNLAFDVAVTKRDKHIVSRNAGYTERDPLMAYNTGVMFSRSRKFWADALTECEQLEKRHQQWFGDQIALVKMVESRKYDVAVLKCDKWNYTPASENESLDGRAIVHYKGPEKKLWMLKLENERLAA